MLQELKLEEHLHACNSQVSAIDLDDGCAADEWLDMPIRLSNCSAVNLDGRHAQRSFRDILILENWEN